MNKRSGFISIGFLCLLGLQNASSQVIPVFPNAFFDQNVIGINYDGMDGFVIMDDSYHADSYDSAYYAGDWWRIIRAENYTDTLGYYRVEGEKVYYKNMGMMVEVIDTVPFVIYDFGLTLGDTAYVVEEEGFIHYVVVSQIQTSTIFGTPVMKLEMQSEFGFGDTWIYGMGSEYGFFYRWMNHFETVYSVCDFVANNLDTVNGFSQYSHSPSGYPCNLNTGELSENSGVQVHYYQEYMNINLALEDILYIYDSSGKLIWQEHLFAGFNEIATGGLAKGIYLVRIGDVFSDKFVRF